MTFLTVLFALLIELVLPEYRPRREHRWFAGYCSRLAGIAFAQRLVEQPWGRVIFLLPPLLLITWLQAFFAELGTLFQLLFGAAVLLYSLGPRDLGRDAAAFIGARDAGMDERAESLAEHLCLGEVPRREPRRSFAVARGVVVLAERRLMAPIFWFVAFGPVGAAGYRAIALLAERLRRDDYRGETQGYGDELLRLADWFPARIGAIGYAVAGNFEAVSQAWRAFSHRPGASPSSEAEQLLADTGLAALDTFADDAEELDLEPGGVFDATLLPPVVEHALALVWRSLAAWVAVIAVGSLMVALA